MGCGHAARSCSTIKHPEDRVERVEDFVSTAGMSGGDNASRGVSSAGAGAVVGCVSIWLVPHVNHPDAKHVADHGVGDDRDGTVAPAQHRVRHVRVCQRNVHARLSYH